MKRSLVLFLLLCVTLWGAACGGQTANSPAPEPTTAAPAAAAPVDAAADTDAQPIADAASAVGCEAYYRFCVAATISGAVDSVGATGMGANIDDTCAVWAAPGEARVLDLPMMQNAGDDAITVALTRIAAYTGPGRYELQAVATSGIPDMFPAIVAAGRMFNNSDGSTAVVTVNADGSGTLEAVDLIEIASLQVSEPDPEARVDFAMQWTCQDS